MATDLHRRTNCRLCSGPLRPALAASIAIPGLFRPVIVDGRVLIDGGATNPLPFDQAHRTRRRHRRASMFMASPTAERVDVPNAWESVFTTTS